MRHGFCMPQARQIFQDMNHFFPAGPVIRQLGTQPALAFTRDQLDRLGVGKDLKEVPWGSKRFKLPPSKILLEKE